MSSRRLDLHASALNDAEYQLYTTSLTDITLADEGNEPHGGNDSNWNRKNQETNQDHDDAYYDRLTLSVREARAWFRGRYSHLAAGTIDTILKFFSPNLSATDTLTGGQFFAAIRLVVHAESGKEVDRTLAFVQAHPPQTPTSGPGPVSSTSTSAPTSPPLPPKRVVPPTPVSRKSFDAAHHNPFASASSQPTETQASQTQTPLQTQPPAPPPQHPSSVSSHNPFSFTTRSKSTPGPPKPFPPSQSHDGSSTLVAETITPSNSKLPPLPPRKPPPPVPSVPNASSSTLPTPAPTPIPAPMPIPVHAPVPLNPPPPPRHSSLLSNATSFLTSSKSPPTYLSGSSFGSPFSNGQAHNHGVVIPPPLPPKHQATTGHVAHVTSTLMKQSLQASKTGSAMKKAEEQLEKERVLSVLKSSSSRGKSPFGSAAATASANNNNNGNKGIGLSRTRSVSPKKQWEESSSGSLDDNIRKEPPPLPSRQKKPKSMSTTSPPGSVLSGVSGKSGASGISGVSGISTSSFQSVALAQNPSQTVKSSRSNPFDVYRTGTGTSAASSGLVSRSPSVSPTPDGRERREGWDETQRPPRHPDHNDATVTPSTFTGAGKARPKPEFSTPFSSPFSTPFSSPSTTMSGAKSASPYVASFGATSTSGRYPSELSQSSVSPFKDPNSNPNSPLSNSGFGADMSPTTSSALSSPTAATSPKETGYSPTNTIRLFRSKSMHHPTSSSTSSFSPVHRHVKEKSPFFDEDVEDDTERDEFGFKTPEETPRQTPTGTPFKHTQTPPVVRRKRPESMQVLGSQTNTLGRHMSMTVNTNISSNPPPVATLRQQLMHKRISSSGSTGLGQDESPSSSSSPIASGVAGTSHIPHSSSQSSSASHAYSHQNPLKSFATSLNSNLEALQPKLDKARYKAEAGLSRRGFVRSRDSTHTGLNGLHGLHESDERERRREEKEGLMGDSQSHSRDWDRDWKRGVDQLREKEKEKGGRETRGRSRWEDTMQSDSSDDDSDEGPDGYGYEEEEERFRIKGLRRGPSSSSTPSHSANHSRTRDSRHGAGSTSEGSGRDPRFGAAGYGSDSGSYGAGTGTGRGVEKDNLKWPVGEDEGWRPL